MHSPFSKTSVILKSLLNYISLGFTGPFDGHVGDFHRKGTLGFHKTSPDLYVAPLLFLTGPLSSFNGIDALCDFRLTKDWNVWSIVGRALSISVKADSERIVEGYPSILKHLSDCSPVTLIQRRVCTKLYFCQIVYLFLWYECPDQMVRGTRCVLADTRV